MRGLMTPAAALLSLLMFAGCPGFGPESTVDMSKLKCDSSGCLICEQYTCYKYACAQDTECPTGYACQASECKPGSPTGMLGGGGGAGTPQCTANLQCPTGKTCESSICVDEVSGSPTPQGECTLTAQCGAAAMCVKFAFD